MESAYSLVRRANGPTSIRSLAEGETFHPVIGPVAEAEALYVRQLDLAGRMAASADPEWVLWDVGLGSAANVTTALRHLAGIPRRLRIVSFERLAHIGADVSFTALPSLVDIDLPKLAHVGGALAATDNPQLPQRALERVVVRLSRRGFSGPVVSGGNAP